MCLRERVHVCVVGRDTWGPPFAVPEGAGPERGPRVVSLLADVGTEREDETLQELPPARPDRARAAAVGWPPHAPAP